MPDLRMAYLYTGWRERILTVHLLTFYSFRQQIFHCHFCTKDCWVVMQKGLAPSLAFPYALCFLASMTWSAILHRRPFHYAVSTFKPANHRGKLLELWAKVNLSSFELWVLDILCQSQGKWLRQVQLIKKQNWKNIQENYRF